MTKLYSAVALAVFAMPAFANIRPVPEPGSLSLVGLALAVGVGLALRKKK